MARTRSVYIDDVGGSFERFVKAAPKVFRQTLHVAIEKTATAVEGRMKANARVGPDAPHIKDDIETHLTPRTASVGYLSPKPAGGSDSTATQPDVALYQEYGTKRMKGNAFMSLAADESENDFRAEAIKALQAAAQKLAI